MKKPKDEYRARIPERLMRTICKLAEKGHRNPNQEIVLAVAAHIIRETKYNTKAK